MEACKRTKLSYYGFKRIPFIEVSLTTIPFHRQKATPYISYLCVCKVCAVTFDVCIR